jgi:hypothetical protein
MAGKSCTNIGAFTYLQRAWSLFTNRETQTKYVAKNGSEFVECFDFYRDFNWAQQRKACYETKLLVKGLYSRRKLLQDEELYVIISVEKGGRPLGGARPEIYAVFISLSDLQRSPFTHLPTFKTGMSPYRLPNAELIHEFKGSDKTTSLCGWVKSALTLFCGRYSALNWERDWSLPRLRV